MPGRPPRGGRLVLDTHVWIWAVEGMTGKLDARAVTAIIPVGTAIALESTQLPDFDHHKDPADRMIVATARRHGTLVTCDESLLGWAQAHKHVRVVDGRP